MISVVIPCFNGELWLAQALESVLTQSIEDVEIVVVNDGSTDRSAEVAGQYGDRIKLIQQTNRGVSAARREGVRRSQGEFIKFLDADDLLPKNALEDLLNVAQVFPGKAVLGRAVAVDKNGRIVDENMYSLPYRPKHLETIFPEFLLTQPTSSGLWLTPRTVIDDDAFFDPIIQFGEEYVFCMALIEKNLEVKACDAVVCHNRQHDSPSRLSRSRRQIDHLRQADLIRSAARYISFKIPNHDPLAIAYIARLCWSRARHCLRIGIRDAAESYLKLAKELDPKLEPVGTPVYQWISHIIGPIAAEKMLTAIKLLLK